jgi:hypothetical protein
MDNKVVTGEIRKVVMPTMALLLLTLMVVTPAIAANKVPYLAYHEVALVDAGKVWVTDGNIQHVKDSFWRGSIYDSSIGDGTFEVWFEHITVSLVTGMGTCSGKFLITIEGSGTVEGSYSGTIDGIYCSGKFIAPHGTGDFQNSITMGSFEAVFTSATNYSQVCEGVSIFH